MPNFLHEVFLKLNKIYTNAKDKNPINLHSNSEVSKVQLHEPPPIFITVLLECRDANQFIYCQ